MVIRISNSTDANHGLHSFDSSHSRGPPLDSPIGVGRLIKGWDEAVPSMKVGEKAVLDISRFENAQTSCVYRALMNLPVTMPTAMPRLRASPLILP